MHGVFYYKVKKDRIFQFLTMDDLQKTRDY
jgi:hypothetical protein